MAAVLVALAAGLPVDAIRAGVRAFRPLGHRLEPVAEIDGVQYVDDSKATNPGSVIAAMRSFEARPIVLIAGGKAKGTDFAEMGKVVSSRAKAVVLIGEDADEIAAVVKRAKVERAGSMEEAVARAADLAVARRRRAALAGLRVVRHVPLRGAPRRDVRRSRPRATESAGPCTLDPPATRTSAVAARPSAMSP